MGIDDFIKVAAAAAVLAGAVVALVSGVLQVWLKGRSDANLETVKAYLKAETDRAIEDHKAALKAQGDAATEHIKSTLAVAASRANAQFSSLNQRRFDAIAAVHGSLNQLKLAVEVYTAPFKFVGNDDDKLWREASDARLKFLDAYSKYAIFLTKSSCEKVDAVEHHLRAATNLYAYGVHMASKAASGVHPGAGEEVYKKVQVDAKAALAELEDEFRTLMGETSVAS